MEVELGIKITHTRDDITTIDDLPITKDHTGPVYQSQETDTMFILTLFLKGFSKKNIKIKISKDGTLLTIRGKRPVQEMALTGWVMEKKPVELRVFKKVFKIPDGVILDGIKSFFGDQESILRTIMPKSEKGMLGVGIQEVKEVKEDVKEAVAPEAAPPEVKEAPEGGGVIEPPPKKKKRKKRCKLCDPIVLSGSAILVSLILFVINFIRTKK